ncbi:hypothetical protein Y032_0252g222 [Ancylostoma ceylanicum]|nr:hypothetical protein Y032_0252g222 [Ancylostoma ceylanicum]
MKIVITTVELRLQFSSAYAPQTDCSERVKDDFWTLLDEKTVEVPSEDRMVVTGDLDGNVAVSKSDYNCHDGFGYRTRNEDGEGILEYDGSHNFVITNTWFKKRMSHLVSFYSDVTKIQIDYVLVRHQD